jgi:uncharacterized protein YndB with AHSA1/START domain
MSEEILQIELELNATVSEVWKRWTTAEGIQSFFAPGCNVELRPDGAYEIFFFPENPPGQRGADGQRLMAIENEKMLSFTWNFPPSLAEIRDQRTLVVLRFASSGNACKLTLNQMGWGEGEIWTQGFEYFAKAWGQMVLPRLKYAIEKGPVDWANPPVIEELCLKA